MQIPLSPRVIHTYIMIIERAYKIKEERKEGGEEGGGGGGGGGEVLPHSTYRVYRPARYTSGSTPL